MTGDLPGSDLTPSEGVSQPDDRLGISPKTANLTSPSNGLPTTAADGPSATMLDAATGEGGVRADGFVRKKLSKLLKGKEEEWTAVAQRKGPLQLLDLPMDILKEIVKEVSLSSQRLSETLRLILFS